MAAILSLHDAVKHFIQDGDTVALEGFTHLIPTAAGHEIIRQGKQDLTLVRMTPDLIYDQLIGAGCARKLIFSWGGNPGSVPASLARRSGKALAPRDRNRGTQPRRPGQCLRCGCLRPALRGAACLRRLRPAEGQPIDQERHLSVHRRGARGGAVGAPRRHRDPRAEG